ncbi:DUF6183 family protein [Kitasatospora griseola]|uniref:DUF6183 family protein n=1 Tax=Kitasatospora griseola TaxID=2064 RepID=UPI00364DF63D
MPGGRPRTGCTRLFARCGESACQGAWGRRRFEDRPQLGLALAGHLGGAEPKWQYRSVLDHLVRLLAARPGAENVRQALRLLTAAPDSARPASSLPASGHRPATVRPTSPPRSPSPPRTSYGPARSTS